MWVCEECVCVCVCEECRLLWQALTFIGYFYCVPVNRRLSFSQYVYYMQSPSEGFTGEYPRVPQLWLTGQRMVSHLLTTCVAIFLPSLFYIHAIVIINAV